MAQKTTFAAEVRAERGKKVRKLRVAGKIPANVSGDVESPVALVVERVPFAKLYQKVGDTGLFYLKVAGETKERPVLIGEVQHDPLTLAVEHVVFRQVNLSEKVTAEVPIEVVGELAVRNALLVTLRDSVEVEALPQDLPEKFEIDISAFTKFGESVTFAQLKFDKNKVSLKIEEEQMNDPVMIVQEIKEQVEEVVAAPVAAEGATPAEGAAAADAAGASAEGKDAKDKPKADAKDKAKS